MTARQRIPFDPQHSADERRQIDFTNLAIDRTEKAIMSVTQLIDANHEIYALLLSVAGVLVRSAAKVRQHANSHDGKEMPDDVAEQAAMLDLLAGLGLASVDWRKELGKQ